jgi:hypothetical protein
MKPTRTVAKATLVGAMSIAAAGLGAGLAHADPPFPPQPPWPIPAPPGHDFQPPPGHGGPIPHDTVVPVWAPPAPPPPFWAPWLPVVWNAEINAWGVWWNGSFQTL